MPDLQAVSREYAGQGVDVVLVNAAFSDSVPEMQTFLKQTGVDLPVYLDTSGEVNQRYRVAALPTTVFINRDLKVFKIVTGGPLSRGFLISEIEKLIAGD